MQYIKDKRTNAIFQIYGATSSGNKNYFIVWDERLDRFTKRDIEDFCPLSTMEENKMLSLKDKLNLTSTPYSSTSIVSETKSNTSSNGNNVVKCQYERQRKPTYVSCQRCDFPVPIDNCNRYCEKYTPAPIRQ